MEFSTLHEVGEELYMKNVEMVNVREKELQKSNKSGSTTAVQMNEEPATVNFKAKRLLTSVMNIQPDLEMLEKNIDGLSTRIALSGVRKDPRVDMFVFELELLKIYIFQSRTDLQTMSIDVKKLQSAKLETCGETSSTVVHEDGPQQKFEEIDELCDVTDNVHNGFSDDDTSPFHSAQTELETAVHSNDCRKTTTAVHGSEDESKPDTIKAPSTKRLQKSGVKFRKGKITFQCHLCGAVTQSGNDHMKEEHPDEKKFPCQECDDQFDNFESMCYHKLIHQKEKASCCQESCRICGEIFHNVHCTRVHLKEAHNVQAILHYPCLICNDIFYLKVDLHTHLDLHSSNDNQQFKCKVCDESFVNPIKLREHLFEHNKKFTCELCGKKYFKREALKRHRKVHLQQVTCQVCGLILRSERSLEEHMNKHTGEKPFECDICHLKLLSVCALSNHKNRVHPRKNGGTRCYICGKMFKTPFARNSHHISAHTEEERKLHDVVVPMFRCDICGETMRAEYKAKHLNKHKTEVEKKLCVCEICGKGFAYFSQLKEHLFHVHNDKNSMPAVLRADRKIAEGAVMDTVSDNYYYVCDICGKHYLHQCSLNLHKSYHHTDKKPEFVCQICGKAYTIKAQLRLHETIHSGKEPYRCEVCGKGFLTKTLLSMHHRTHTGEKPHSCQKCGLRFNLKSHLTRHVSAVHKKERRFQCELCNKRFAQKINLNTHQRIHTGEKRFSCPICGHQFSDQGSLQKHKQLHAKI